MDFISYILYDIKKWMLQPVAELHTTTWPYGTKNSLTELTILKSKHVKISLPN